MCIVNWQIPRPLLTVENLAWLGGFMLVFWAPFWSGARLPLLLLIALGMVIHVRAGQLIPQTVSQRRWGTLFLLLFLPCLLASVFSLKPQASLTLCLVLLLHVWVGLALLAGLRNQGHARLASWIGLTLLFWSLDGLIQFTLGQDLFGTPLASPDAPKEIRVTGPFGDNLHMSLFVGVMMPLLLWPLARTRPWTTLFLFPFMSTIAFLSGARTVLVFTTLTALALMFRLPAWKYRVALLALCFAPLLVVPLSPVLHERVMQRDYLSAFKTSPAAAKSGLYDRVNTVLSGRLWIWETASNMVLAHPLTGVGPGAFDSAYPYYVHRPDDGFRAANNEGKHAYHAHQMYLGMAAESGLIGLGGLLACIFLVGRWFRRASPPARDRAAPYLACLAVIAFPINSQPVLFSGWWFPIVLLLLCGFLAAIDEQTPSHAPRPE